MDRSGSVRNEPALYIRSTAVITREYGNELVERNFYGSTMEELTDGIQPILELTNTKGVKYYRMVVLEEELCQS